MTAASFYIQTQCCVTVQRLRFRGIFVHENRCWKTQEMVQKYQYQAKTLISFSAQLRRARQCFCSSSLCERRVIAEEIDSERWREREKHFLPLVFPSVSLENLQWLSINRKLFQGLDEKRSFCNLMSGSFPGISQSRISHWLLQHGSDLSEQKKRAFYRWYTLEKTTPGTSECLKPRAARS